MCTKTMNKADVKKFVNKGFVNEVLPVVIALIIFIVWTIELISFLMAHIDADGFKWIVEINVI